MAAPWRTEGSVERVVPAPPDVVYRLVADVTGTGHRSLECRRCHWLPGAPPGTVGARFRGHNRSGPFRWSRVCEVTEAEPGRAFAFRTVPERFDPTRMDQITWRYDLRPAVAGTVVRHAYRIDRMPLRPLLPLYGRLVPHHRDMRPHMAHTLSVLDDQARRAVASQA